MIFSILALLPLLAQSPPAPPPAAGAAQTPVFTESVEVRLNELALDVTDKHGHPVDDLKASDLEVLEGGQPAEIVALDRPEAPRTSSHWVAHRGEWETSERFPVQREPWEIVIYVDQLLSGHSTPRDAARSLSAQLANLVSLGRVEVVIADPAPSVLVPATRDPKALAAALQVVAGRIGDDVIRRGRERAKQTSSRTIGGFAGTTWIRAAVLQEHNLLKARLAQLEGWMSGYGVAEGRRVLFLVGDGFDLSPVEYYLTAYYGAGLAGGQAQTEVSELREELRSWGLEQPVSDLAKHLAARGWEIVSVAPSALSSGLAADVSDPGRDRFQQFMAGGVSGTPESASHPLDPLQDFAAESGGTVLTNPRKVGDALEEMAGRWRLAYRSSRPRDGVPRPVEVRSLRPGLKITSRRWAASPTPEELVVAHAHRAYDLGERQGELVVGAWWEGELKGDQRVLTIAVPISRSPAEAATGKALEPSGSPPYPLRLGLVVERPNDLPFTEPMTTEFTSNDSQAVVLHLKLKVGPGQEHAAVAVDDPRSGAWGAAPVLAAPPAGLVGGGYGAMVNQSAREAAKDVTSDSGSPPAAAPAGPPEAARLSGLAVALVPPPSSLVGGRTRFEALAFDPAVAQVVFQLDGREIGRAKPPDLWVDVDLGDQPAVERLEAVALDAAGAELGRDALWLNAGLDHFAVRFTQAPAKPQSTPVAVELSVDAPLGHRVTQVELRWNDSALAHLTLPP
jgi:VWFA-related protein